jgi:hypothetical protein
MLSCNSGKGGYHWGNLFEEYLHVELVAFSWERDVSVVCDHESKSLVGFL